MVMLLLFLRLLRSACCVGLQHSFVGSSCSCTILIYVSAIYISCNKLSRPRRIGAGNWCMVEVMTGMFSENLSKATKL
jgi:hypothetical protein